MLKTPILWHPVEKNNIRQINFFENHLKVDCFF